jgi:hypothetical protein
MKSELKVGDAGFESERRVRAKGGGMGKSVGWLASTRPATGPVPTVALHVQTPTDDPPRLGKGAITPCPSCVHYHARQMKPDGENVQIGQA